MGDQMQHPARTGQFPYDDRCSGTESEGRGEDMTQPNLKARIWSEPLLSTSPWPPNPLAAGILLLTALVLGLLGLTTAMASAQDAAVTSGPDVTRSVSCLAGNGRVDHTFVNTGAAAATYRVEFEGLTAREVRVAAGDWGRISLTGRADNTYQALVQRDGVTLHSDPITVACDVDPTVSTPEVRVITACRAGFGYVLAQFVNPSDAPKSYIIEFEDVPNRSITVAPFGAGLRAVTGRPDDTHAMRITSSAVEILTADVIVDCDAADPDDNDGDGVPNDLDPDDDNDGISDEREIWRSTDPLVAADCSVPNIRPGADLHACDFSGAAMDGVDLAGAQLIFANLEAASLIGADLSQADISATNFRGATLTGALLVQALAEEAVMSGASLARADLTELQGTIEARETDFSGATLDRANIRDSDLTGSDFTDASVRRVTLGRAFLNHAVLVGADLSDSNAEAAELRWANLERANLQRVNLDASIFAGAIARDASFAGASAGFAILASTDLTGANFEGASLPLSVFISADLSGANLTDARLDGATWGSTTCPDGLDSDDLPNRSCEPCSDPCLDTKPVFVTPNALMVSEGASSEFMLEATGASFFTLIPGLDAPLFFLSDAGVIKFKQPTDFESPLDYDDDNVYLINVAAANFIGDPRIEQSTGMTIAITVTDLPG